MYNNKENRQQNYDAELQMHNQNKHSTKHFCMSLVEVPSGKVPLSDLYPHTPEFKTSLIRQMTALFVGLHKNTNVKKMKTKCRQSSKHHNDQCLPP